ncbi:MAG: hypothetical protein ABR865_02580 [Terracidiphilus sp.]|jgi:hypothetical protein
MKRAEFPQSRAWGYLLLPAQAGWPGRATDNMWVRRHATENIEWRPTLAGCKVIIHQHLDTTLTLMIAGHRVGHYSAEGKLLTPLPKKQIKAVEKTMRGKVPKQTFPLNLQIPHTTRDSHFPTASATADY